MSRRTRNTTTSPQPGRVPATVPQPEPVAQPTEHDTAQTTSCDDAVSDHDASRQAQADAIAASAGGYALLYSAVDGWELYHGDELLAGHDGIEAGDLGAAQAWTGGQLAGELGEAHRVTVVGWSTRPCRYDPGSVEHVAEVAALRLDDLDAGATGGPDGLPPLPDLLAELAGLGEPAGRRRVHEVIRALGAAAVAVQQEYRDALCPTYLPRSDWKSALAEAKQHVRDARRTASNAGAGVDEDDRDDDTPVGDGAEVLDAVAAWIGPYLALPSPHYLPVLALWAAHTHAAGAFYVTPRLVLDSAEPESGKTRVLELLNLVCRRPELILSPTTPAIFRMLADGPMTLLFDEVDAIFNPQTAGNHEDLRALLNAGYKRGATIPRCVGDAAAMKVHRFAVFAPVALAGLAGNGNLPATILTRAVVLHMRKRPAGQKVKPFSERDAEAEAEPVRKALRRWVRSQAAGLALARPKMPDGVEDRPAEVWEALLAIADAAGGHWPDTARAACEHFVLKAGTAAPSFGVRLLGDLRRIFGDEQELPTVEILNKLTALDEAPWADLGGKPIDSRRLAKELKRYEIVPVPFNGPYGKTVRGYTTYAVDIKAAVSAGLADAWSRYLSANTPSERNERNERNDAGRDADRNEPDNVTGVTNVMSHQDPVTPITSAHVTEPATEPALTSGVTPITPVTPETGQRTDTPPERDRCPDCAEAYDSLGHQINCEGLDAP